MTRLFGAADMTFYKHIGFCDGREHGRDRAVVLACILHSCEGWSWTEELVDTVHRWESRSLEIIRAWSWITFGWQERDLRIVEVRKSNTFSCSEFGDMQSERWTTRGMVQLILC